MRDSYTRKKIFFSPYFSLKFIAEFRILCLIFYIKTEILHIAFPPPLSVMLKKLLHIIVKFLELPGINSFIVQYPIHDFIKEIQNQVSLNIIQFAIYVNNMQI